MEKERKNALEMGKEKKEKNKASAKEKSRGPLRLATPGFLSGIAPFSLFR